ncbi:uncharacterized protein METZ01_LOCUS416242 [marine metagenome]|uniref:Uncharacterized protein n=1 Tax=marine metagenome TaxID=408172 RepID=A0A382WYU5_9ZZZZ
MDINDKQITSLCKKPFGLNARSSRPDWLIWFGLVLTTAWMAMLEYKENPREASPMANTTSNRTP